jgi:hypothetical protein
MRHTDDDTDTLNSDDDIDAHENDRDADDDIMNMDVQATCVDTGTTKVTVRAQATVGPGAGPPQHANGRVVEMSHLVDAP